MSNKISEIKSRLREYTNFKGFSQRKFNILIDASDSFLKSNGGFNVDFLPKIRQKCPDLNLDWLLFGEGEMILSSDKKSNSVSKPGSEYSTESLQYQINVINEKLAEFDTLKQTLGSLITAEVQHQMQTSKKNVIDKHKKGVE